VLSFDFSYWLYVITKKPRKSHATHTEVSFAMVSSNTDFSEMIEYFDEIHFKMICIVLPL